MLTAPCFIYCAFVVSAHRFLFLRWKFFLCLDSCQWTLPGVCTRLSSVSPGSKAYFPGSPPPPGQPCPWLTLETHAFPVCPPFGIDNQVVERNFLKLLTLLLLVNIWQLGLQPGESMCLFPKAFTTSYPTFHFSKTTRNSFKQLNLFQLIAKKKKKSFLSYCFFLLSPNLESPNFLLSYQLMY